ncbi:potassium channel protein [Synechococcus sp. A15-24]|uniref:potassium channel family protein n=1 Tax=Synechococcus sp. A15-24 TaxID=1050635 RepID=UPI001645870D|nr:potassium channel protein [Synechococcus sp. A15-24]QNJ29705.1 potassium ion channel/ VIC family [Synechococcus sp. A15-24]
MTQGSRRRTSRRQLKLLAAPWRGPFSALSAVILIGAIGYRLTEGWDWGDCLWMVLITISTIGYGEVETLSPAGRLVTVLIVVGGLIVVQLAIQRVLGLKDAGYFRRLQEFRIHRMLESLHDHVILCGYGRIGQEIAAQLQRDQIPLVVIETDPDRRDVAEANGLQVLQADATLDETLLDAGLERCQSLVAALPGDASNLYVTLSARGLNPSCRLIARANSDEAATKLRLAGATVVVSPYVAGGRVMAASALRPLALNFMELLAGSDFEIEEFQLSRDPLHLMDIRGRSLAELELGRRSGALVLAIRDRSELIANPGGETQLAPGQLLIVLGSKPQLKRFQDLLGEAVDSIETMAG